jgi:hypothetical protein
MNLASLSTGGLYFRLDSDINFAGTPFNPIPSFSGTLDGQNHSIQNVGKVLNGPGGVFQVVNPGSVIRRLNIQNVAFQGDGNAGGLVGLANLATIEDVIVLNGIVRGGNFVGGVIGVCDRCVIQRVTAQVDVSGAQGVGGVVGGLRGTMTQARAHGAVSGSNGYVGGVFGYGISATVSNCLSTGSVIGTNARNGGVVGSLTISSIAQCGHIGDVAGIGADGGVAGEILGVSSAIQVFSRGTITSTGFAVGGLAGYSEGTILDGYHQGDVFSPAGQWIAGGVGFQGGGTITNVYAAGSVTGAVDVGGLVGITAGVITNSYWNIDLYAVDNGLGSPLTTAQMGMTANFTGWNFTSVWEMGLVFPALQWE